jgi:hypothetical protein
MTGLPVFDMHRAGGGREMYKFQLTRLTETRIPITHAGPLLGGLTMYKLPPFEKNGRTFFVGFKGDMIMAVLSPPPES